MGIGVNPSPNQADRLGADMRIRVACNKRDQSRQNLCFFRAARASLAPVARQRVQSRTANATVRVIEHRDQVIHRLWNEEVIEKLTAPITHIRAVMPKTLSYRRKRGETISQQSAMRTRSVVRDRQLPDKFSPLIAHVVLRFTSFSDNSDLGGAANK